MRLSEAIRLGAALKPQAFNADDVNGSCALRAATEALGMDLRINGGIPYHDLAERFAFLDAFPPECPAGGRFTCNCHSSVCDMVWHLNDAHRWTREQIADWIELNFEPIPEPLDTFGESFMVNL